MKSILGRLKTARRVLANDGLGSTLSLAAKLAGMWWRRGEAWQIIRKSPIARLDHCRFSLLNETRESRELLLGGDYELPERTAIRNYLCRHEPVVELGANRGVVACTTNRLLRVPANSPAKPNHVVVEANPFLIPLLENHKRMNGCSFFILHAALAYGTPEVSFTVQSNPLASSLQGFGGQTVTVPTVTLEHILHHHSFTRATVICDTEGAEFSLLENDAKALSQSVTTLIVEVHIIPGIEDPHGFFVRAMNELGFEHRERIHDTHVFENRALSSGSASPS